MATLRRVGERNEYSSSFELVTFMRPRSAAGRAASPGASTAPKVKYPVPPTFTPSWQAAQPFSMKSATPARSSAPSAFASPASHRSNGAPGVTSVASKASMALATLSKVSASFSPGNAFAKSGA